eukprot:7065467-Prymnesium_polylepis.1
MSSSATAQYNSITRPAAPEALPCRWKSYFGRDIYFGVICTLANRTASSQQLPHRSRGQFAPSPSTLEHELRLCKTTAIPDYLRAIVCTLLLRCQAFNGSTVTAELLYTAWVKTPVNGSSCDPVR